MRGPLSPVIDQAGSWFGAPSWDIMFVPVTPTALLRLRDALIRDASISLDVAATVAAQVGPSPVRAPLIWHVNSLAPLGLIMREGAWHGPSSALVLTLPPRIASVCITPDFARGEDHVRRGPRTRAIFDSFLGLARRLAREVPLRQASFLLEGGSTEFGDQCGVVLPAEIPGVLGLEPVDTRDGESLVAW